jgi:glyoxylate/hydroxypyruvate reductase
MQEAAATIAHLAFNESRLARGSAHVIDGGGRTACPGLSSPRIRECPMTLLPDRQTLHILIASPLEADQVARIAGAAPDRAVVIHTPHLLPTSKYVADHNGTKPQLGQAEKTRWLELLADADILFDFDWLAPERLPETAPRLRWVQGTSAGISEFLERTGLARSSILITTAAGIHASALAEFTLLGLLYFRRRVPWLRERQAMHSWQRYTNRELAGTRVLVVGLGAVGREIARTLAALGLEVWGSRRSSDTTKPPGVTRLVTADELREVLPHVQALVLSCPLTSATHHMIGRAELAALSPDSVLVNIGRGALIDEPQLIAVLREKRIAGAVLDVFETEPLPPDNPLWDMPNVLVSPHSASTVEAENRRIVDLFIANLHRYLAGQKLINQYGRERGY